MSSRSIAAELGHYARTRLLRPRILALGVVVGACGAAASAAWLEALPTSVALAMALAWQFRLWDDLEDVAYDRAHHPERVLLATGASGRFKWALVSSVPCLAAVLALTRGPLILAAYAALIAVLAFFYRILNGQVRARLLRSHLVLSKYPVFTGLTAVEPDPSRAVIIAIGLYLALCVFETMDDPALRDSPKARRLAILEGVALLGMLAYGAIR